MQTTTTAAPAAVTTSHEKPAVPPAPTIFPCAWFDVRQELPDDESTVLVGLANGEAFLGYSLAGSWYSVEGFVFEGDVAVHFWADIPQQPKRADS
jgi:hypothetical protein